MIKIVKETKKALFIEKDGKQTWIQRRWLRADNTLTAAGEKSMLSAKPAEVLKAEFEDKKEWDNVCADVVGETEKAYKVEIHVWTMNDQRLWKTFIPKSLVKSVEQVKNGESESTFVKVKSWFSAKKLEEIQAHWSGASYNFF